MQDDLRLGDRQLVALSAHILYENGKVQLAASGNLEAVGGVGLLHDHADIDLQLLVQSFADMARGYIFTDLARERRLVDHEVHGKRRFFNVNHFHRLWVLRVTDGLSDGDICNAGDDDDIAAFCLLDRHALESSVDKDLIDLTLHDAAVCFCHCHRLTLFDDTLGDAPDAESADVVIIGECRNLQLQRLVVQIRIRLAVLDDSIKERRQI